MVCAFRSSSGDQICSQSKQFLNGLDLITVGTTNVTALKEFQYRMGNHVSYMERNQPVRAPRLAPSLPHFRQSPVPPDKRLCAYTLVALKAPHTFGRFAAHR